MRRSLSKNKCKMLLSAVFIIISLFHVETLAGPVKTLDGKTYRASELIKMGYTGYELEYTARDLTLTIDEDLKLIRFVPAADNMAAHLTVTGENGHTLTLDSYDSDISIGWHDNYEMEPASLKGGSITIQNTTVNARGIWNTILAKYELRLNNATILTDAADSGIASFEGSVYIQNGCKIDCTKRSSNPIIAMNMIQIADSNVKTIGMSTGIRCMQGKIVIKSGTVYAEGAHEGIQASGGVAISGGTVEAKSTEEGYYEGNAGIESSDGPVVITGGNVTVSGSWSGIANRNQGNADGKIVQILGGTVDVTGTKSAISSINPVVVGSQLMIRDPEGGKTGRTDWNEKLPYGILTASGQTAKHVLIGLPSSGVSEEPAAADEIASLSHAKDPKGSVFSRLRLKGTAGSTSIRLTWKRVPGAKSYVIYGCKCGNKKTLKRITNVSSTSWTQRKLKKGTYYRYVVVAVDGVRKLAASKTVHVVTKGGKYGNHTDVIPAKKTLYLKKGKITTLKVAEKRGSKPVQVHRKLEFESDNKAIATVSSKGKIKALRKGTCFVYAYVQNGVYARVKVVVK